MYISKQIIDFINQINVKKSSFQIIEYVFILYIKYITMYISFECRFKNKLFIIKRHAI